MKIFRNPPPDSWKELSKRPSIELDFLDSTVRNILNRVKTAGDHALLELARQYDGATLTDLRVSEGEFKAAEERVDEQLKSAIQQAAKNIRKFHEMQLSTVRVVETMPGVTCWRKFLAIEKVGIYIPGGTAPLFSTVLMLGIPASIAGCEEVILCTPPNRDGSVNPAILYAASLCGIKNVFKAGGAQAIGAMAFGTETISPVYKIFGPGNQFVTKAKQLVNQQGVAIDLPAGPSEVMIIADPSADPSFIAADLLSQAEHGTDSQVVLLSTSESVLKLVNDQLVQQLERLPRKEIAAAALQNSLAILFDDMKDAISFANEFAPEHLIINTADCEVLSEQIRNAGSVFLGPWSPEAIGDYASGTNHTLPTNGYAKSYSGVSIESFSKSITYQSLTKAGLQTLGPVVECLAEAEQLMGHKWAITQRLQKLK
jgi:histidinol dehydrogenase